MGRPRKTVKLEQTAAQEPEIKQGEETNGEEVQAEGQEEVKTEQTVDALAPGQAYFESPSGEILIGDASKDQLWWRQGNDGRGMWINKRR